VFHLKYSINRRWIVEAPLLAGFFIKSCRYRSRSVFYRLRCRVYQICARPSDNMLYPCSVAIIAILYFLFDVNYFVRLGLTILWGRLFEKRKKLFDITTIYGELSRIRSRTLNIVRWILVPLTLWLRTASAKERKKRKKKKEEKREKKQLHYIITIESSSSHARNLMIE